MKWSNLCAALKQTNTVRLLWACDRGVDGSGPWTGRTNCEKTCVTANWLGVPSVELESKSLGASLIPVCTQPGNELGEPLLSLLTFLNFLGWLRVLMRSWSSHMWQPSQTQDSNWPGFCAPTPSAQKWFLMNRFTEVLIRFLFPLSSCLAGYFLYWNTWLAPFPSHQWWVAAD